MPEVTFVKLRSMNGTQTELVTTSNYSPSSGGLIGARVNTGFANHFKYICTSEGPFSY